MKSPLAIYAEAAKEYGVTPEKQLHVRQKLAYIEAQVQEQQAIINRLLFDVVTTELKLADAKDNMSKQAIRSKLDSYKGDLQQLSDALDINLVIKKELDQEFKKTGEEA